MTREEAIKWMEAFASYPKFPLESAEACRMAIEALQEPERQWIPCSQRLPIREECMKDDGRFILDDGNRRYQGLFDIYDGKFKFSKHVSGFHYELIEDDGVIAWMPLPESYKAGEQE